MRHVAEQRLGPNPRFRSVTGRAEATELHPESIDILTVAQAFHWFSHGDTSQEFRTILKPGGWCALLWNKRRTDCPFLKAYDGLLRQHVPEYTEVNYSTVSDDAITAFLGSDYQCMTYPNRQLFDLDGLKGRMQSSSYTPTSDRPEYQALVRGLEALFDDHAVDGQVAFNYETQLHIGRL